MSKASSDEEPLKDSDTIHPVQVGDKIVYTVGEYKKAQADLKRRREDERATFSEDEAEPVMSPEALELAKKMMAGQA